MISSCDIVIPSLPAQSGTARNLLASFPDFVIPGEATNLPISIHDIVIPSEARNLLFARDFDHFVVCRNAV